MSDKWSLKEQAIKIHIKTGCNSVNVLITLPIAEVIAVTYGYIQNPIKPAPAPTTIGVKTIATDPNLSPINRINPTAIDAVNSNRTAIYVGGREFRGVFAAGAIALTINGVLDESGIPVNNFEAQMEDGRKGYEMKNTVVSLPAGAGAGA